MSGGLKKALRELYKKVHPDLFHAHPAEREANEASVKLLHAYLDALDGPPGAAASHRVYSFDFYIREPGGGLERGEGGGGEEGEAAMSLRRVKVSLPSPGSAPGAGGGFGGPSGSASGVLSFLGSASEGLAYLDEQAGIERLFRACGVDVALAPGAASGSAGRRRRRDGADGAASDGIDALREFVRRHASEGARRAAENARLEVEEANLRAALRMNRSLRVVYRGLPPFGGGRAGKEERGGREKGAQDAPPLLRAPTRHERVQLLHLLVQALGDSAGDGSGSWVPGRPTTLVFGSECRLCRVHGHVHLDASRLSLLGGAPTGVSTRTADAIAGRWSRFLVEAAQPDALDACQGAAVRLRKLEALAARALGCSMIYASSDGIASSDAYGAFLGGLAAEAAAVLHEDGGDPVAAAGREARAARDERHAELLRRHEAELEERRRRKEEDARPLVDKLLSALEALGGRRPWARRGEQADAPPTGEDGEEEGEEGPGNETEAKRRGWTKPPSGIPDLVVMVTGGDTCSVDATNGVLHLPVGSDSATARALVATFGARAAGVRRSAAQEEALTEAAARQAVVALRLRALTRAMPDREADRESAARSRPHAQAGYTGSPVDDRVFRDCCAKLTAASKQLRHLLQGSAVCVGDRFEVLPSGVLVLDAAALLAFTPAPQDTYD